MSIVAIDRCESYEISDVSACIEKICAAAGMPDVAGRKILLKPNILSDAKPEAAITTNPQVVRALIRLLKEKGASEIYVGDSPGLHSPSFAGRACGIGAVCDEEGATWVNFMDNPVTKQLEGTKIRVPMASILDKVDMVFSVCKFKSHTLMYTTGATKNLFGTVPSVNKAACHAKFPSRESFAKVIIGIHETIRPSFCIMDAVIGMEGAGPANGTPRQFGYLMASDSCLAMDMTQAQMMGYETSDIPILKEAERRHVLPTEIRYPLLNVNDCIIKDFDKVPVRRRTKLIRSLLMPFLTSGVQKRRQRKEPGPQFDSKLCIRCLRCVKICPQKALELQKQEDGTEKVVCDYRKCIRCYCCHEMCPVNAIHVEDRTAR